MEAVIQNDAHTEGKLDPGKLGLWLFILSEILLFGAFFSSYFVLRWGSTACRLGAPAWPASDYGSTLFLATLNTVVLITSSYTVIRSLSAVRRGDAAGFSKNLKYTMFLALGFLIIKGIEYYLKFHHGYYPGGSFAVANPGYGIFFSFYFVMTGLHGLHVVIGLIWMWMLLNSRQSRQAKDFHRKVEFAGLYWHFVDVVWVFLFPLFYLV